MNSLNGCLVWIRFGTFGRQLAHVDEQKRENFYAHKWVDNRRWWTGRIYVESWRILPDDVNLMDPVVQRALHAATPGKPPCHHKHHFIPQVKRAPSRQVVHA